MTENLEIDIYRNLTSELPERYKVVRSVVYKRLEDLHIKPQRRDNRSYLSDEQLQLMDDLHAHLGNNGKTEEFVQQCIEQGRIVPDQTEALVTQAQAHEMTTSPPQSLGTTDEILINPESSGQDMVADLQAQKGEKVQLSDIQEVDERAQQRAFAKAAAEETLTLIYEATEEFTIPGLKEQLEQHRAACRQAKAKRGTSVNDFLSKTLAFRTTGANGSTGSPTSSSNQSPTSNGDRATA